MSDVVGRLSAGHLRERGARVYTRRFLVRARNRADFGERPAQWVQAARDHPQREVEVDLERDRRGEPVHVDIGGAPRPRARSR